MPLLLTTTKRRWQDDWAEGRKSLDPRERSIAGLFNDRYLVISH